MPNDNVLTGRFNSNHKIEKVSAQVFPPRTPGDKAVILIWPEDPKVMLQPQGMVNTLMGLAKQIYEQSSGLVLPDGALPPVKE